MVTNNDLPSEVTGAKHTQLQKANFVEQSFKVECPPFELAGVCGGTVIWATTPSPYYDLGFVLDKAIMRSSYFIYFMKRILINLIFQRFIHQKTTPGTYFWKNILTYSSINTLPTVNQILLECKMVFTKIVQQFIPNTLAVEVGHANRSYLMFLIINSGKQSPVP